MTTRKSNRKLTLDDIKTAMAEAHPNIEVLDTEYYGSKYKLSFKCRLDGYNWKADYSSTLIHKYACRKCQSRGVGGENHHNWNGGITEINAYLRRGSEKWKARALNNYKVCQISGVDFDLEVHHLFPAFHTIARKVFENTGIDVRVSVSEYSNDELDTLLNECERLHNGCMPAVWTKELHREFHRLYGNPEYSAYQSTMYIFSVLKPMWEYGDTDDTDISVLKSRLCKKLTEEKDGGCTSIDISEVGELSLYGLSGDSANDDEIEKFREERILRRLNNSNNFFGKLHGMKAEDFYNCLDRGLRTYEERLESVNNMFYPNGVLHPYWEGVFEQPEGGVGNIKLLLNSSDTIYSESNVATVLNAVGTYLLEPFMNEDDNVEYKIFTDYKLFREAIRHLSYEHIIENSENPTFFNIEDELLFFRDKRNFKKEVKQVIDPNDYSDPQIGRLISEYRNISNEITLKKNMIRDLKSLTNKQIEELDDYYRANVSDSQIGVPQDFMWEGRIPNGCEERYEYSLGGVL